MVIKFPLHLLSLVAMLCLSQVCFCFKLKRLDLLTTASNWSSAGATWYGSRDGAGSDGGACGYGNVVGQAPFSSMVAAGGPSLFKSGKGCGACYEVKCTEHPACSGSSARVVITDECPGGPYVAESTHFDLSGTAFGAMAISGQANELRNAGVLKIQYATVACKYPGKNMVFHINPGSNPNSFSFVVEFEDGDGDLASVDLREALTTSNSDTWFTMRQSWGANWRIDSGSGLEAPFSIRLTSQYSGRTLVAGNVIPVGWKPGATYRSLVNYDV